ncbi:MULTISPECIES: response regulator transcription factor [Pseudoalteromonas]|uniref:response regulator transcription factor n=1 Tax=Pseudoalteromonas TaxID=53246 RepID=UPI00029AFF28|nr:MULTISPECIES: LuxR C-terminal-related transcriptional regulator [Pseudoalteromonas]AUJ72395.1 putative transcriptional regulatory protein NarL [Pseudoalteromonas sp. NC201]MCF2829382.1 LuxR C-terminal-related transcriptional regulator [Pseudoalteromonas sp. OF5H-5]MCF2831350.1 LuxR C-terminal-related transcriptional regulator [Pseudoalteromonas sp. DL2-H6]MCF2927087.1 LuxR C-terminal-related transcriptional regulator [Pseudoalteromonas sp. DL2-H1]MCX2767569.1 LuxR C-terminal-related transcr
MNVNVEFKGNFYVIKEVGVSCCFSKLSSRERDVLLLLLSGKSYKDIAFELHVSSNTVKFHCGNIYDKLGVANRKVLSARYFRHDVLEQNEAVNDKLQYNDAKEPII